MIVIKAWPNIHNNDINNRFSVVGQFSRHFPLCRCECYFIFIHIKKLPILLLLQFVGVFFLTKFSLFFSFENYFQDFICMISEVSNPTIANISWNASLRDQWKVHHWYSKIDILYKNERKKLFLNSLPLYQHCIAFSSFRFIHSFRLLNQAGKFIFSLSLRAIPNCSVFVLYRMLQINCSFGYEKKTFFELSFFHGAYTNSSMFVAPFILFYCKHFIQKKISEHLLGCSFLCKIERKLVFFCRNEI